MKNADFDYDFQGKQTVFEHTLSKGVPYIASTPRNHESIFLVTKGNLLYDNGGEKAVIKSGEVGYIARGSIDISSAYLCDGVTYIATNFAFDDDSLQGSLPFKTLCSVGFSYKYEEMFEELLKCYTLKIPGYRTACKGILLQIIGSLFTEFVDDGILLKKFDKISDSLEYLRHNYSNDDLTVTRLAEVANMSTKQFRRTFSDIYKMTPYTFLLDFRINEAKKLLKNTQNKLSDIALQCGFADLYSFSHSFKKNTGMTPSEYRRRH